VVKHNDIAGGRKHFLPARHRHVTGYYPVLFVVRGRKLLAWILGFFQSAVFIIAISSVLTNDQNVLTIIGYAGGFATGNVVGMWIEERLAIGHIHLTIVSPARGAAITDMLRAQGYAVTEISGRGLNGMVTLLHVDVMRRQLDSVENWSAKRITTPSSPPKMCARAPGVLRA